MSSPLVSPTPQYEVTAAEVQAFIAGYLYAGSPTASTETLKDLTVRYFQGKITTDRIDALIAEAMS